MQKAALSVTDAREGQSSTCVGRRGNAKKTGILLHSMLSPVPGAMPDACGCSISKSEYMNSLERPSICLGHARHFTGQETQS